MVDFKTSVIVDALKRFSEGGDLREACIAFLNGFKFHLLKLSPARYKRGSTEDMALTRFLSPEFIDKNHDTVEKILTISYVGGASPNTFTQTRPDLTLEDIRAKINEERYKGIAFFCIDVDKELKRAEVVNLSRAFNRRMLFMPVVLFIRQGNFLTLTTCERTEAVKKGYLGEKVGKVTMLKGIDCREGATHPGHINILKELSILTVNPSFDEVYANWLKVFDNELLTRRFYQELSDWYAWAIKEVRFPNDILDPDDDVASNHKNVIRLVTRLIFVWFLKEKHLIPEELFKEDFIRDKLIRDFEPHKKDNLFFKPTESKYYKAVLQNLFFATLNCPIVNETGEASNRRFCKESGENNNSKVMKYKKYFINPQLYLDLVNQTVPFLNGGLFDCLDDGKRIFHDGFTEDEKVSKYLVVPDYLFFGNEAGKDIDLSDYYGDENKRHISARGIIDILKHYQFTIEENTPYDQEVSLDPELLGKVFENLLAAYNPETQQTARNRTGSFYTRREIVQYMVDESLIEYLKKSVGAQYEDDYRDLLSYSSTETGLNQELRDSIMKALYNCKILDPACGSGAFPVGILQQMVHILSKIDPTNDNWYNLIIEVATAESRDAFLVCTPEERKERIVEINSSFDDALNYPDYARKLYLIENCIYGVDIQEIAIQISHLRFFISLVVDQRENHNPLNNFGIRPLPNLEAKFVAANSLISLEKHKDIFSSSEKILTLEKRLHEANHNIFSAKTPQKKAVWKEKLIKRREEYADALVELGYVSQDAGRQIASWDMFNQNTHASFFDPEWMFGVNDGFDIVIGNPPYIQLQENDGELARLYVDKGFRTFDNEGDIFSLFYERGWQLLKDHGSLCYITSNKWMRNRSGENTRAFFSEKTNPVLLINFAGIQLFNATVETNILLFNKEENSGNTRSTTITAADLGKDLDIYKASNENFIVSSYDSPDSWVILTPEEQKILLKVAGKSEKLSNWNIRINFGIKTGYNKAFIIDGEARNHILSACGSDEELERSREIIRPILRGRDIKRYRFYWANLWIINTHNGIPGVKPPIDIVDYPAVKKHLDKHFANLERRADKGRTPYNLRNCAYIDDFALPKIIWGEISDKAKFCFDEKGEYYCEATTFFMTGDISTFLFCYLNSKLAEFLFSKIATTTGMGTIRWKKYKIQQLYVPHVGEEIEKEIEEKYARFKETGDESWINAIDKVFYDYFELSEEQIAIIEGKQNDTEI